MITIEVAHPGVEDPAIAIDHAFKISRKPEALT